MKRSLMAAVVAGSVLAPLTADAQSTPSVTIYGRAHVTVDWLDNGANDGLNTNSNSSRLGFRASHDLNDNLKAIMQVEQEVRWENGSGNFASRDTFVGLQGDFGRIRLGFFDTPLKEIRGRVDFFGDQIGDARNLTRVRDGYSGGDYDFDTRFRNGIHYTSPKFGGLTWDLHYSTNTDAGQNLGNKNSAVSTALTYADGPWYAAIAYEQKEDTKSDAIRMGLRYGSGPWAVAGLAQFATVKGSTLGSKQNVDTYGIGASYKVGDKTTVKGQYYWLSADGSERDAGMLALGLDYQIARPFRILVAYARTDNDDNVRYGMSRGGHGGQQLAAANGLNTSGFSVGFRYDF